jgi:hypothetical protein
MLLRQSAPALQQRPLRRWGDVSPHARPSPAPRLAEAGGAAAGALAPSPPPPAQLCPAARQHPRRGEAPGTCRAFAEAAAPSLLSSLATIDFSRAAAVALG